MVHSTPEQTLAYLEQELEWRERDYPAFISSGQLPRKKADHHLKILCHLVSDYRRSCQIRAHTRYPFPQPVTSPTNPPPPCHPERSRRNYRPDDRPRHAFD